MKYKYRIILRGDGKYCYENKKKGFWNILGRWFMTCGSYVTEQEAIKAIEWDIQYEKEEHLRRIKKVTKVIDND